MKLFLFFVDICCLFLRFLFQSKLTLKLNRQKGQSLVSAILQSLPLLRPDVGLLSSDEVSSTDLSKVHQYSQKGNTVSKCRQNYTKTAFEETIRNILILAGRLPLQSVPQSVLVAMWHGSLMLNSAELQAPWGRTLLPGFTLYHLGKACLKAPISNNVDRIYSAVS